MEMRRPYGYDRISKDLNIKAAQRKLRKQGKEKALQAGFRILDVLRKNVSKQKEKRAQTFNKARAARKIQVAYLEHLAKKAKKDLRQLIKSKLRKTISSKPKVAR